jgi:putative pyruvate formate lyase activating enzyme
MKQILYQNYYTEEEISLLSECTLCPRECKADRFSSRKGTCGADAGMNIASICIHRGEEPAISGTDGICNIFFGGCNLRCRFCQNHEISDPRSIRRNDYNLLEDALDEIEKILSKGIKSVGFVSPSHVMPQVKAIIRGLTSRGLRPVYVYNTNAYDKRSVIKSLDGLIDVYLPDFKYANPGLSKDYSGSSDYPGFALGAIKEMYYQKGSSLLLDEDGMAYNGMLISHLVLPGHTEESKKVLKTIAEELSPGVHLSLMSQYHPTINVKDHPLLGRTLYRKEYQEVVECMEGLGFRNGWIQDMDSNCSYRPDFSREHPFE